MKPNERTILVTGGAGYVGSRLVPILLSAGYKVRVLDTCWYGVPEFEERYSSGNFSLIVGDIRDPKAISEALSGATDVIHLACISNDPSYDLDPDLGKSINLDAFVPLVRKSKDEGVGRFIYASSSSVYGVKKEDEVTENLALEPLTDYSKFKAECEVELSNLSEPGFVTTVLRPATICGPASRQRMDLTVNLLTNHAVNTGTHIHKYAHTTTQVSTRARTLAAVAGGALIGVDLWKSAALAGIMACAQVVEKLLRFSVDGSLTKEEIELAFTGAVKTKPEVAE
jgi:nucleoside-diphosphate-sugar epimerase